MPSPSGKMHVVALGPRRRKFYGCVAIERKNFLFAGIETSI
jgi:hypothetical protein